MTDMAHVDPQRREVIMAVVQAQSPEELRDALRRCAAYAKQHNDERLIEWLEQFYVLLFHLTGKTNLA